MPTSTFLGWEIRPRSSPPIRPAFAPPGLCLSCRDGQLVTTSLAPEPPFRDPMPSFLRRSLRHCPVTIKLIDVFSALHWSFWSLMVRLTDHVGLLSFLQGAVASCSHMHAPCPPLSGPEDRHFSDFPGSRLPLHMRVQAAFCKAVLHVSCWTSLESKRCFYYEACPSF